MTDWDIELAEGGGAVCQVEEVKVEKADLLPMQAKDADALTLDCAWSVRGKSEVRVQALVLKLLQRSHC